MAVPQAPEPRTTIWLMRTSSCGPFRSEAGFRAGKQAADVLVVLAHGHQPPGVAARRESAPTSPPEIMSGLTSAATSINEDEDGGVLSGFDDILKLSASRDRRFELVTEDKVEAANDARSGVCHNPLHRLSIIRGT